MTQYGIESYIGVPLLRSDGELFGTLCALDPEPREISEENIETLELLARLIAFELEAEEQTAEREEALRLAEKSNETRARFMGVLGHDLRSPLNTIVMAANIQKKGLLPAEQNAGMAEKILRAAKRMKYLIEDLLDTTQTVQGNRLRIERKPADLEEICRLVVEEFVISNPDRTIEFSAAGDLSGWWDEGRLGQVVSNLLSNAIHYGTPDRPIAVFLHGGEDRATLEVTNYGRVIAPAVRKNLFRPFWRGARKRSHSSGLGLGLYIVKQIVDAHGGSIDVVSDQERGTTFTVVFEKHTGPAGGVETEETQ